VEEEEDEEVGDIESRRSSLFNNEKL